MGGVFIKLNVAINKWRKQKYYGSNRNKVIELAVISVVTASCSILLPMAFHCQSNELANPPGNFSRQNFFCPQFFHIFYLVNESQTMFFPAKFFS